ARRRRNEHASESTKRLTLVEAFTQLKGLVSGFPFQLQVLHVLGLGENGATIKNINRDRG
ncbi:MAG TPA: hypothetical protein VFO86_09285, partial [Terriglobia bacterium]|nr:hypothetical protein [Terriglobia bacterium]